MNRASADANRLDLDSLRREFDQGFARAPSVVETAAEGILAVFVGAGRYALRASEIDGVAVAGKVIRVPSPAHGLAGVTGIRGAVLPVFSLATLLGEAPGETAPGWLFFVGREDPLAFAFHGIAGYRKFERGRATLLSDAARTHASLREVLTWDGGVVPVVHVPSLESFVRRERGHEGTRKEAK